MQVALGVDEQVRSLFTLLTASLSLYVLGLQVLENVGGVQVAFGVDEQIRSLFTLLTASLSFHVLGLKVL